MPWQNTAFIFERMPKRNMSDVMQQRSDTPRLQAHPKMILARPGAGHYFGSCPLIHFLIRFTYELRTALTEDAIVYIKSLIDAAVLGDLIIELSAEGFESSESPKRLKKHS